MLGIRAIILLDNGEVVSDIDEMLELEDTSVCVGATFLSSRALSAQIRWTWSRKGRTSSLLGPMSTTRYVL